jgi:hypothetical protein
MESHELAKKLLNRPNVNVTASLDVTAEPSEDGRRVFSDELDSIQQDNTGDITLLFVDAYDNNAI